jgi:hypothetical protein
MNQQPPTVNMTMQPSFATEIPVQKGKHGLYESMISFFGCINGTLGACNFLPCGCCCFTNPYRTVNQGEVGLFSYYGKFYKSVDPGLHFVLPFVENLLITDIRMQIEDLPSQVVMTKDNVAIIIDSGTHSRLFDLSYLLAHYRSLRSHIFSFRCQKSFNRTKHDDVKTQSRSPHCSRLH